MADEIAEQLLGRDQRAAWCGDLDPTGRFMCSRIREHELDWHAGRRDDGGIQQWPAAPPGVAPPVDGDLRQRCVSALDGMVSEFISPNEWGGYDVHYGELVDIVLDVVRPEPERQDAEIQRLKATNETLLAMLERMETLHVTWFGPGGEEVHPEWCRECRVDKVRAELAEVRASREAWAIEAMGIDAELAERPTAWAYEQANQALEKRRVALVTALGGSRPGQGFYDAVDDVEGLVEERAALSKSLRAMSRDLDSLHGRYTIGASNALRVVGLLLEDISKASAELRKAAETTQCVPSGGDTDTTEVPGA